MKLTFVLFLLIFWNVDNSFSQQQKANTNHPLVQVTSWKSKSMMIVDDAWEANKDQIVAQLGEEGYEKVKNHSSWKHIPAAMSIWDGQKKKSTEELRKKLDSLKVIYKIATFNYQFQGKDWGKKVVLMVPYKGNETWDAQVKWDTVYFILDENDVTEDIKKQTHLFCNNKYIVKGNIIQHGFCVMAANE